MAADKPLNRRKALHMKQTYKINFTANTVTVTKTFLRIAQTDITSPEFKTLTQLREMGLTIVEKPAPRRKNVHRATYKQMLAYISCVTDAARYLAEFETVRLASLEKPNPYQYVRDWYDRTFPNRNDIPEMDENGKIINFTAPTDDTSAA